MLKIHHLNCGCMCPFGGALIDGVSKGPRGLLVCHCLLIETDAGLVLVDTGFGRNDVQHPYPRLSPLFGTMMGVQLDPALTALSQVERLGFKREDVRHIVLTHLDFDHAGGLQDFPHAEVHLLDREMRAAADRDGFVGRRRYRPAQWGAETRWQTYQPDGEPWHGFASVRQLRGLPPEILLIPLPGHTLGHCGVAIQGAAGWLLHAGDAYFYRDEVYRPERRCTPGLRLYQRMMEVDRGARLANQDRLRALSVERPGEIRMFCSHDRMELAELAA